jgi:hypothetical protein
MSRFPAPAGFVSVEDVRKQLALKDGQWRSRLREHAIQMYGHPSDKRQLLLREQDAQILLTPQPVNPGRKPKAVAS